MNLRLSVGRDNKRFEPLTITSIEALKELIITQTYSCGVYKNEERSNLNFEYAACIALDFDDGMSVEAAVEAFKSYKNIIAPSRNHRRVKGGKHADRFRVVLFLSEPVTTGAVYTNTVRKLMEQFPMADRQCSDPARMFYASSEIYSENIDGKLITPVLVATQSTPSVPTEIRDLSDLDFSHKLPGISNCRWAMMNGFFEQGEGNEISLSLVTALKGLGYTKSQSAHLLYDAHEKREARIGAGWSKADLDRTVINQVYGPTWRGAVYSCKIENTHLHKYCNSLGKNRCSHADNTEVFNFQKIGDIRKSRDTLDWVVNGLFTTGGLSILAGLPKTGKSTLIRQLTRSVARGTPFLKREVKKGPVVYLALEEQTQVLGEQYRQLGMDNDDNIVVHIGPVFTDNAFAALKTHLLDTRPTLLVIDTIALLSGIKDINSYNEVTHVFGQYRALARESGTHIMCIHHQNKSAKDDRGQGTIMGSTGIAGAVDCLIIFSRDGNRRIINSEHRGGIRFDDQPLDFSMERQEYSLGEKHVKPREF